METKLAIGRVRHLRKNCLSLLHLRQRHIRSASGHTSVSFRGGQRRSGWRVSGSVPPFSFSPLCFWFLLMHIASHTLPHRFFFPAWFPVGPPTQTIFVLSQPSWAKSLPRANIPRQRTTHDRHTHRPTTSCLYLGPRLCVVLGRVWLPREIMVEGRPSAGHLCCRYVFHGSGVNETTVQAYTRNHHIPLFQTRSQIPFIAVICVSQWYHTRTYGHTRRSMILTRCLLFNQPALALSQNLVFTRPA
ncbi:hypothetical protein QBC47DRAFT_135240 [Echria macrotheca]|uniref:Uncharacterized protein n=1 Tax=Echria macrotheca TaxID=438768 RepID=A0AAJ0BHV4_9PEZI|nr:hypothetical protein QBC47DRAFT_135240 [Echria macrotheca]